jgi:NAD(P)-dependent dehydrogenase (short-subunit alcohol dehydrogenase family)
VRDGAALVVGASGAIGAATAAMLAERGSALALAYRTNAAVVEKIAAAAPTRVRSFAVELASAGSCAALVRQAAEEFGGLHTVVYAAGPPVPQRHLSRIEPALLREHLEVEAAGFFNVVAPSLPYLRESRGSIVAVTSAAVRRHAPRDVLSAAPKAAIEAMVRGLAVEEGRFGVRVNSVRPGMLTDGMAAVLAGSGDLDDRALQAALANTPLRRLGSAADVAEAVCFLAGDRAGFITGQHLGVDGGYGV